MAKLLGKDAVILLGANDISAYFRDMSIQRSSNLQDVETYGDVAKERMLGLPDANIVLTGLYDDTAANIDAFLNTAFVAANGTPFSAAPAGYGVGKPVYLCTARKADYKLGGAVGVATPVAATVQGAEGIIRGISLHNLIAATGTGAFASHDNSAATSNGAWAIVHVTVDDVTTMTLKIQDSANDADWSDLMTFAAITTTGSELITLALGSTVRRYVRANVTAFTGTSATFACAYGRL